MRSHEEHDLNLVATAVDIVATDVVRITLADPAGADLPAWEPGAHIDLVLTPEMSRQYSLCGSPTDTKHYVVAVLLEREGRGGSIHIHDKIKVGTPVHVRGPRNHFELVPADKHLFIAGGIGVTPLIPMIEQLDAEGAEWQLVYGGHTRAAMSFIPELAKYGDKVTLLPRDEVEKSLSKQLDGLLGTSRPDTLVYCCGPEGLLDSVEKLCEHWPSGALHLERFAAKEYDGSEDHAFEVVLTLTGITVTVPPERSILETVQDHGVSVLASCRDGVCGTCETLIIEGEADHRDSVLNAEERAANESMMVCVSRCKGDRLVLDL